MKVKVADFGHLVLWRLRHTGSALIVGSSGLGRPAAALKMQKG